jgi:hypothetical protein
VAQYDILFVGTETRQDELCYVDKSKFIFSVTPNTKHRFFLIGKSLCGFIFIIVNYAEQIIICIQSYHNIVYYSRYTRL